MSGIALFLVSTLAVAEYGLNFPKPVTSIGHKLLDLHNMILIICTVIFVIVFGVMFYSILKHRKSVGHKSQELAEPIWVELGWTIVPLLIVIGLCGTLVAAAAAPRRGAGPAPAWSRSSPTRWPR